MEPPVSEIPPSSEEPAETPPAHRISSKVRRSSRATAPITPTPTDPLDDYEEDDEDDEPADDQADEFAEDDTDDFFAPRPTPSSSSVGESSASPTRIPTPRARLSSTFEETPEEDSSEDELAPRRQQPARACKQTRALLKPLDTGYDNLTDEERKLLFKQADRRYKAAHRDMARKYGLHAALGPVDDPSPHFDVNEAVMLARPIFLDACDRLQFEPSIDLFADNTACSVTDFSLLAIVPCPAE
jgi:hypothetical protein